MSTQVTADFKSYQERVTSSLVNVIRSAGGISNHDLSFHRSVSDTVSKSLDAQNAHLLRLTSKLLKAATKETNIKPPSLQNKESVEDDWRKVVDVIDDLLEKADANLDEFSGLIKRNSPAQQATPEPPTTRVASHGGTSGAAKPQLDFHTKVDNFATDAWKPLLKAKPHALMSLRESIGVEETGYKHPYAEEIARYEYPSSVYVEALPTPFTQPDRSEAVWVDTEEGVLEMLEELKMAKAIAVDLEHNDRNSYVGLVCLMQISTRNKDWIVDTLKPWRQNLSILNEVFANPNIIKVFHGSSSDMIWLQRDLGLYAVGLFDTYHAACALNFPGKGLAHLLQKYAYVSAQKQYQLADWRVRPLTPELLDYARSDTHYLLYIFDNMRNELVRQSTPASNLVDYVLEHSKKESLQVYERHFYDRENGLGPDGWLKLLLVRNARSFDKQQFGVFRALHEWRDQKAREVDEGVHSIMSNNFLWGCAENMPDSRHALFGGRFGGRASYYVGLYSQQVLDAIKRGKREGLEGPTVQEVIDRNADKIAVFRHFKQANPNAKPQELQQSVAVTMQQLVQTGELRNGTAPNSIEPLATRSISSSLWGAMFPTVVQSALHPAAAKLALESLMPLQSHVNDTSMDEVQDGVPTQPEPLPVPPMNGESRIVQEPDIDVPFTLKDRKNKRLVDEVEAEDDLVLADLTQTPTKFPVTDEGIVLTQQQARREFKKARKEIEKAANASSMAEYKAFDYANAASVLHAQPEQPSTDRDTRTNKPMNPFAKALDASTGARRNRLGKELAGKSHTFKS